MKGFFREFVENEDFCRNFGDILERFFRPFKEIFVAKTKHPRHY